MSGIIKAGRHTVSGRDAQGVAFNFDDVTVAADARLEQIRRQAAQIIADAKQQADQIRQNAVQEGRQAAEQAVESVVTEKVRQQMQSVLPALESAVEQLAQARHEWIKQWEQNAVHLAAAIAERIVRRELSQRPEITLELVREALELAAGCGSVQLRLNPSDRETLGDAAQDLAAKLAKLAPSDIIADPDLSPGGCLVTTEFGEIDQRIESQLARIEEELA